MLPLDIRSVFNMVNTGITRQGYIPAEEVATLFGVTKNCLAKWRSAKDGPAYYRLAGRVYYKKEDLEAFIEHARVPTAATRQPSTDEREGVR
jgi:hypothetical protein